MTGYPVHVEGFAYGGEALGRLPDGRVCFFRGGAPGDTARIVLSSSKRNFARGLMTGLDSPGSERIIPHCPLAAVSGRTSFCPGCSYQQVDYSIELLWKQRQLSDFLVRGGLAWKETLRPPVPAPSRFGWRNRLKLSASGGNTGFFTEDNITVIPVEHCPLAVAELDAVLPERRRELRNGEVFLRWTAADGVVVNGGTRMLTEELPGIGRFKVPAESFFQTNIQVAARLVDDVRGILRELRPSGMLELYCGVGVFSLAAAAALPDMRTWGIELDAAAIRHASGNAAAWGLGERCRFRCGKAERTDPSRCCGGLPDVLLLDPPRRGIPPELAGRIREWKIPKVVYISCAPDTLARDLRVLGGAYRVERCGLYDMFPCTGHFETLVLLGLK